MEGCGNCLFQGKSRVEKNGIEVPCLYYDAQWHKDSYKCDKWQRYYELSLDKRIDIAHQLKSGIEAQQRHQEILTVAKEANIISKSAKRAS